MRASERRKQKTAQSKISEDTILDANEATCWRNPCLEVLLPRSQESPLDSFISSYVKAFENGDANSIATQYTSAPMVAIVSQGGEAKSFAPPTAEAVEQLFTGMCKQLKDAGYAGVKFEPNKITKLTPNMNLVSTRGIRYKTDGSELQRLNSSHYLVQEDENGFRIRAIFADMIGAGVAYTNITVPDRSVLDPFWDAYIDAFVNGKAADLSEKFIGAPMIALISQGGGCKPLAAAEKEDVFKLFTGMYKQLTDAGYATAKFESPKVTPLTPDIFFFSSKGIRYLADGKEMARLPNAHYFIQKIGDEYRMRGLFAEMAPPQ